MSEFSPFPRLPPELRNKIWGHVANQEPRALDLWTDFKRCEIANTIFYTQAYECELSHRPPPPIFRVNSESRKEALKHYTLEFATGMTLPKGISVTVSARIYINYSVDILLPRGYWNLVAFSNLASRAGGRLKHLAVDVNGSLWKDNLRDYCKKRCWVFYELQELILYDSSGVDMFKRSDFLEKFRERYRGGPKDLSFTDWVEDPTAQMVGVKNIFEKMFDRIEGKVEEEVEKPKGEGRVLTEADIHPSYLKDCEPTHADDLQRPVVRLARLEVTEPTVVPI
ncbi:uncharacterized protein LY89DRAFT_691133 [Mollisia scopiformis]|uniref:2EXR domain-containing protein n=1 Tax=Mollisia scopiformis TaxID=149040 RepID=A0A132B756_MOLSC|nr:uncharacterized protein LY89DRAFT_691133 [Mollisia scopiformis]KUJ08240.1 hypothetical protein LY89DRAFT_691133 [Mollisia scopiformis]